MSVKPAIIFLLFALSAFGQPNPINRRAMAIAGLATGSPPIPQTIPGLSWWWVGSDIVGNIATNWIDRIQAARLTNTVANCLFATNGIVYPNTGSSGESLRGNGTITVNSTNTSVMIIFMVTSHQNTILFEGVATSFGWRPQSDQKFYWRDGSFHELSRTPVAWSDMVFTPTNTAGGYRFFTNGIQASTSASVYTAWTLGGVMPNSTFDNERLREILIWTNTLLSSVNISNLHYYATNTYAYTP